MKKLIYTFALAAIATGAILTSCNSSSEKVDAAKENVTEANSALDEAKDNYNKQYEKFKTESENKIAANDIIIAELKEHAVGKKKEIKDVYEKTIADLEAKNEAMKEKVENYKGDGNEQWESFQREFNHDMDELGKSLSDLTKNNVK